MQSHKFTHVHKNHETWLISHAHSSISDESHYVQTCSREKKYGFTPNLDFNLLLMKFNLTKVHHSIIQACSMQHMKRSKRGISIGNVGSILGGPNFHMTPD